MIDYTALTEEELYGVVEAAKTEIGRRQTEAAFTQHVADLYEGARDSGAITPPADGAEWVQPLGAHDAYVKGDTVTHAGKTWVSTVTPNTWEPGVSGWHPESVDGAAPEWVRPSGTHDAYALGDRVTYQGQEYESVHPGANTWAPDEYGWEPTP